MFTSPTNLITFHESGKEISTLEESFTKSPPFPGLPTPPPPLPQEMADNRFIMLISMKLKGLQTLKSLLF